MPDQAECVILEAEDQVTPVGDKANAGLDSFEKNSGLPKAEAEVRPSHPTNSSLSPECAAVLVGLKRATT